MNRYFRLLGFAFVFSVTLGDAEIVGANEKVQGTSETPVTIMVEEKTLLLNTLEFPKFEEQEIKKERHSFHPLNDLVIEVNDKRTVRSTPWSVDYQLSIVTDEKNKIVPDVYLRLERGIVTETNSRNYESFNLDVPTTNESRRMLRSKDSSINHLVYRIPKEKITLHLPKELPVGKYKMEQSIFLKAVQEEF